jgi:hypothetical protein
MKLTDDYCENYEKNMDERELLMLGSGYRVQP